MTLAQPMTVLQVTRSIKNALEACFPYAVQVEGEISNYRPHFSGHAYFTLKDSHAQLSAVMWKSRADALSAPLENGQKYVCTGQVTVYEKSGRYQMNVVHIKPVGTGDLQARYEALKQKFWELGYFDESHKRPLPNYPQRIGVITSPTGAAIRDVLSVARRRNPAVQIIVRPCQVQGEKAAPDIVKALHDFNQWKIMGKGVDLIILGRGGGSLEDLWAFNEESVAEAIFASQIPIISAVGHEVDTSLSDLVADQRAATPSAAAELAVPSRSEMLGQLLYYRERGQQQMQRNLKEAGLRLQALKQHHRLQPPHIHLQAQRAKLSQLQEQLQREIKDMLGRQRQRLVSLQERIEALAPHNTFSRGFVQLEQKGHTVRAREALNPGKTTLYFADGAVDVNLQDIQYRLL